MALWQNQNSSLMKNRKYEGKITKHKDRKIRAEDFRLNFRQNASSMHWNVKTSLPKLWFMWHFMLPNNVFVNCQNATILIRIWINFYFSRKLLLKRSLKEAKPVVTLICKLIIIPLHYLVAIVERNMSDSKLPIIVVCSEGVKTSREIIDSKFYRNSNFNASLFIKKSHWRFAERSSRQKHSWAVRWICWL